MELYEKTIKEVSNKHVFVKINFLTLAKISFMKNGFFEPNIKDVIEFFDVFFNTNYSKCIKAMKTGYQEDMDEIVIDFFYKHDYLLN